jgi:hypothetical protein
MLRFNSGNIFIIYNLHIVKTNKIYYKNHVGQRYVFNSNSEISLL